MNNKEDLRQFFRKKRSAISAKRKEAASKEANDLLYGMTSIHKHVMSFASKDDEIDLWPLNQKLALEGRLILPRLFHNKIVPYFVEDIHVLSLSKWGVLEPNPKQNNEANANKITCVLVPGLAFDRNHHRIGYGLGHFDRFLINLSKVELIGVGFKEQLSEDLLPADAHDIALHRTELF